MAQPAQPFTRQDAKRDRQAYQRLAGIVDRLLHRDIQRLDEETARKFFKSSVFATIHLAHIAHVAIKAKDSALVSVEGMTDPIPLSGNDVNALITLLDRLIKPAHIPENQAPTESQERPASRKTLKPRSAKAARAIGDPRSSHPAIQAVKAVLGRYPQKVLYDKIIEAVGDEPDVDLMMECATVYASRGKFTGDLSEWLFDWYVGNHGAPTRHNSKQKSQSEDDGWEPAQLTPGIVMASENVSREEAEAILKDLYH